MIMKIKFAILFFLMLALGSSWSFGQEKEYFYTIVGEKFESENQRDSADNKYMRELEHQVYELASKSPSLADSTRLNKANEYFKTITLSLYMMIVEVRNNNKQLTHYLNEYEEDLSELGILATPCQATNGEAFNSEEMRDIANISIALFHYIYDLFNQPDKTELKEWDIYRIDGKVKSYEKEFSRITQFLNAQSEALKNIER